MSQDSKFIEGVKLQGTALVTSGVMGAITRTPSNPPTYMRGRTACQVGSAIGAAAASGAGVSGSLSAGAAVIAAKIAAGTAIATAAAPILAGAAVGAVIVGGVGYGIRWLLK
jgi:hypothetical protein